MYSHPHHQLFPPTMFHFSQLETKLPTAVVLKVWSQAGTNVTWKYNFLDPTLDLLTQKLGRGEGPVIYVVTKPVGKLDVH